MEIKSKEIGCITVLCVHEFVRIIILLILILNWATKRLTSFGNQTKSLTRLIKQKRVSVINLLILMNKKS